MNAYERTVARLYELSQSNKNISALSADKYIESLKPLRLTATEKAEIHRAFQDFFQRAAING
ncbi:MAG TPA: hypothetical protein VEC36_08745 [Patescibacteria group bacterium]|nr:hypothetical protein [Patescibacteria group bacterium]